MKSDRVLAYLAIIILLVEVIFFFFGEQGGSVGISQSTPKPAVQSKPQPVSLSEVRTVPPVTRYVPQPAPQVSLQTGTILNVPFASQAPFGEWSDERQQFACEETSALMAMHWVSGQPLTREEALREILTISDYEAQTFGEFRDTSAADTVSRIFKGYFHYANVELRYDITTDDIKRELDLGHVVIVPVDGQLLKNPFYTPPGPIEHEIVIIGYDSTTDEFITHDPGTIHGAGYRYSAHVLNAALQDYPTGVHIPITNVRTAMIVVKKS